MALELYLIPVILSSYLIIFTPIFKTGQWGIPSAHWTCFFSPLWILWKRYIEEENKAIHTAHIKYGEIVRLGPNEVSIACVDGGIRTVYSGDFEKLDWYPNQFQDYGVPNMFSMALNKPHAVRKRMISKIYSKSYLQSSPDLHTISRYILFSRLLPVISSSAATQQPIESLSLNYATSMDFISAFIFGLQNGANFIQDKAESKRWLAAYKSRLQVRFWTGEMPGLTSFLIRLGIDWPLPKWVFAATRLLEDWTMEKCEATALDASRSQNASTNLAHANTESSFANKESNPIPRTEPIVYNQLFSALTDSIQKHTWSYPLNVSIASEIQDQIAAAHETTGNTLTYLMYELSLPLNHHFLTRLRAELLTLSPPLKYPPSASLPSSDSSASGFEIPSPSDIDSLPLLHACLMETLRLHGPVAGPQPRITPSQPTSLAGSPPLPPRMRVSAQAYTLHRNANVFPEPEVWRPERWLKSEAKPGDEEEDERRRAEMARWFWAFGSGAKMCIGSNFAMQEMKFVITAIYTNFTTHLVEDTDMEQTDGFAVGPKGDKLLLRFECVEDDRGGATL